MDRQCSTSKGNASEEPTLVGEVGRDGPGHAVDTDYFKSLQPPPFLFFFSHTHAFSLFCPHPHTRPLSLHRPFQTILVEEGWVRLYDLCRGVPGSPIHLALYERKELPSTGGSGLLQR